jgi:hypothetical protein
MNLCPLSDNAAFYVILAAMYIYVIYKLFEFGTLISSKIWTSQAKNSQAKASAWEVVERPISHGEQKDLVCFERGARWTHSLQC